MLNSRRFTVVVLAILTIVLIVAPSFASRVERSWLQYPLLAQTAVSDAETLLQQGRTFYQAEDWTTAAQYWKQAATIAATQADPITQAIALSNLALAYQQLGNWTEANATIGDSLKLLNHQSVNNQRERQVYAQVLNSQGKLQFAMGQSESALESWQQATRYYTAVNDHSGITLSLLNQTQALKALGLLRRSNTILEQLYANRQSNSPELQLAILLNYGDTLRLSGRLSGNSPNAQTVLQQGLELADRLSSASDRAIALISLGNTADAERQRQATQYFDQSEEIRTIYRQIQESSISVSLDRSQPQPPSFELDLFAELRRAEKLIQVSRKTVEAIQVLTATAQQAKQLGNVQLQAYALWRKFYLQALQFYQQAASLSAPSSTSHLRALLSQQRLLLEEPVLDAEQLSQAQALSAQIQPMLDRQPVSHANLYDRIQFAQNLLNLKSATDRTTIWQLLETVVSQAKLLNDRQAHSYALGYLGALYEQTQQWQPAQALTQQALALAQATNATNLAYRWQWQLGRLLKAQNNTPDAIAAYTQAVANLTLLRKDLATLNTENADVQFSFKQNAEPIYLEFVELLLQSNQSNPNSQNLEQARSVVESLQIAELENFFQEACAPAQMKIEGIDKTAAIIYPIVLKNQFDVIVSLYDPTAPQRIRLHHYSSPVPTQEVELTVNQFRQSLIPSASFDDRLILGQKIYNWLIRPIETDLEQANVKTLVFIMNGNLRNIPMAALYNGKQLLIENYNVAFTPGLRLIEPKPLKQQNLKVLIAGLTESTQGFPALPSVKTEVQEIKSTISSQVILNENLTNKNLEQALNNNPFNTIHLATHGQFSSNADQTFILTWDNKLSIKQFDTLLRTTNKNSDTPLELLVLSACQTATGDRRAALGLAGIAVRSGARSTVASLWSVNDETTAEFMTIFYQALTQVGVSKVEALSIAQRQLLAKYTSPYYWAPFVIVGSWL